MPLIDRITSIYDKMPLKSLKVKEWENETIWYKPLTGDEYDQIQLELDKDASGPRNNAQMVIVKSLDAQGVRLFKNEDIDVFMTKAFTETSARISKTMMQVVTPEEAEKN